MKGLFAKSGKKQEIELNKLWQLCRSELYFKVCGINEPQDGNVENVSNSVLQILSKIIKYQNTYMEQGIKYFLREITKSIFQKRKSNESKEKGKANIKLNRSIEASLNEVELSSYNLQIEYKNFIHNSVVTLPIFTKKVY